MLFKNNILFLKNKISTLRNYYSDLVQKGKCATDIFNMLYCERLRRNKYRLTCEIVVIWIWKIKNKFCLMAAVCQVMQTPQWLGAEAFCVQQPRVCIFCSPFSCDTWFPSASSLPGRLKGKQYFTHTLAGFPSKFSCCYYYYYCRYINILKLLISWMINM